MLKSTLNGQNKVIAIFKHLRRVSADQVSGTVQVINIVVGLFASVTKNLENWLESWT